MKAHDKVLIDSLPPIEVAPNVDGCHLPLRSEIKSQLEFLYEKSDLNLEEPVYVIPGIDATRATNRESVTVFSIKTVSTGTCIGIVGAVAGGDHYENMAKSATPFLRQVEELVMNPIITTAIGNVQITVRIGGDLSNLYDLLGLGKATGKYSCPCCILPKDQFFLPAIDVDTYNACNDATLGRTMANIQNEAKKSSNRAFSVKNPPLTRVPVDPTELIVNWIMLCLLHATMRLCGTCTNYLLLYGQGSKLDKVGKKK